MSRFPVNSSLRKTPSGWKVWDITVEGISYIKTFRPTLAPRLRRRTSRP
ncbi:MAG: ABC transporter substrate-binding protein [Proteobacteria bacterium]|nr:ABC transporter substrate-binding protein [Pseudomonadota bacterium]